MIFGISTMRFLEEFFGDMIEDLSDSKFKILITLIDFKAFQFERYLYNKDTFDRSQLLEFLEDFRLKRLKPFYRSQKRPTQEQGELVKIVGKTFQEAIYHSKESVLVLLLIKRIQIHIYNGRKKQQNLRQNLKNFYQTNQQLVNLIWLQMNTSYCIQILHLN